MIWLQLLFWISVAAMVHAYITYPILILRMARGCAESIGPPLPILPSAHPKVTVLIAAYNAEKYIRDRIENLLASDYPMERLAIVIASDGSTDGTVASAREVHANNLAVYDFKERRGKTGTLLKALQSVESDVVVFSDVSTHFSKDAIGTMARHFTDSEVGIVSGQVRMLTESGVNAEGLYWKLESSVRQAEAKLNVVTGVSGAIYAIRRSMMVTPARPTINDDMLLPILTKNKYRCKFIFEAEATAEVIVPRGIRNDFRRRRRIGLGAFQSLPLLMPTVFSSDFFSAFCLTSHKLLRWAGPIALVVATLCNLLLLSHPFYQLALTVQAISILLAIRGLYRINAGVFEKCCGVLASFYLMNAALAMGFVDWIFASRKVVWEPTARPNRSKYMAQEPTA